MEERKVHLILFPTQGRSYAPFLLSLEIEYLEPVHPKQNQRRYCIPRSSRPPIFPRISALPLRFHIGCDNRSDRKRCKALSHQPKRGLQSQTSLGIPGLIPGYPYYPYPYYPPFYPPVYPFPPYYPGYPGFPGHGHGHGPWHPGHGPGPWHPGGPGHGPGGPGGPGHGHGPGGPGYGPRGARMQRSKR